MTTHSSLLRFLLVIADVTQTRHWFKSRSLEEHNWLGNLYETVRGSADAIAEYLAEAGEQDRQVVFQTQEINDFYKNIESKSITDLITAVRRVYATMRTAKSQDSTFCSLIDELDKQIVEISYQFKQVWKNIKALKTSGGAKVKARAVKASNSFLDVAKIMDKALKQLKLDKHCTITPLKSENLFIIVYEGSAPNKAADTIIQTLENNIDGDWVIYLEDIESGMAVIHCERN